MIQWLIHYNYTNTLRDKSCNINKRIKIYNGWLKQDQEIINTQVFARIVKVFTVVLILIKKISRQLLFFHGRTTMAMKTADKASISITRVKSLEHGLKETERNKVYTRGIRKKYYEMVWFLWSYKVRTSEFAIRSDRGDLRMDIKSFKPLWAYPTTVSSKLSFYTLVQLIWGSYII